MSSSMSSRKEELLAKKARLAELKRQRELRQEHLASGRHSLGGEVGTGRERFPNVTDLFSRALLRARLQRKDAMKSKIL